MNDNNNATTPATKSFRKEGEGFDLSMLPTGHTPVYYGFNCRPRQVKYYKVEKAAENILDGYASRSVAVAWVAKVKEKLAATEAKIAELNAKAELYDVLRSSGSDFATRDLAHKARNKTYNQVSNLEHRASDFKTCIEKVEAMLNFNQQTA